MAGKFGPEVLLILEAQRRSGAQQIAGASDPQALALMQITADHQLFSEKGFWRGLASVAPGVPFLNFHWQNCSVLSYFSKSRDSK